MVTTTLNAMRQTRHLSSSTHAYDDGELDMLLAEAPLELQREVGGRQFLSPEILAQILSGGGVGPKSEERCDDGMTCAAV